MLTTLYPSMQMNEISNAVQDHRISKLISSFAGRPPKSYEEKASKFFQYDSTLSEQDRTKRKCNDVTTHDIMKGNKIRNQQAYHIVALYYVHDV